ncbi:MAG TPA: hypothetical protein VF796_17505 [Humisphaera sp.]
MQYLDGSIGPDGLALLNRRLAGDPAARDVFVGVCVRSAALREQMAARHVAASMDDAAAGGDDDAFASPADALARAMVLPAVRPDDPSDDDEPAPLVLPPSPPPPPAKRAGRREGGWYALAAVAAAAAVLAAGGLVVRSVLVPPREPPSAYVPTPPEPTWRPDTRPGATVPAAPPAVIAAARDAQWDGPAGALRPGATLRAGQTVRLRSGLAEVKFADGAVVVLQGPAELTVVHENAAALGGGKLAADVPPTAAGFTVTTAGGLAARDLGTQFGVSVAPDGLVEVHVFLGRVDVADAAAPDHTHLVAGEAVRKVPGGASVTRIPAAPAAFVSSLDDRREPVPLRNTGVGLGHNADDPAWQVVAATTEPDRKPAPAVVVGEADRNIWHLGDPRTSQWVTVNRDFGPVDGTGSYTFRTTVDLTGFDPATVRLRLKVQVDDELTDVRVNGRSARVFVPYVGDTNRLNFADATINGGFVAGRNVIDFVVTNREPTTQVGMRMEWEGTGARAAGK